MAAIDAERYLAVKEDKVTPKDIGKYLINSSDQKVRCQLDATQKNGRLESADENPKKRSGLIRNAIN
jgi:hypothetical protein